MWPIRQYIGLYFGSKEEDYEVLINVIAKNKSLEKIRNFEGIFLGLICTKSLPSILVAKKSHDRDSLEGTPSFQRGRGFRADN